MEYIHLVGAETVEKAAYQMRDAVEVFGRQVGYFSEAVDRLARILDEHARRIEEAMRKDGEK